MEISQGVNSETPPACMGMQDQYNPTLFKNRIDGGKKLGQELRKLYLKNPVVIAIPSGGVPVGIEVTKILKCPFDLIIVRKIQFPWTTESGFGAVASDGTSYLSPHAEGLTPEMIEAQTKKARQSIKQREKLFTFKKKKINLKNKTVILVDDGLATGATMTTAIRSVRRNNPNQVIVASPTASKEATRHLSNEADQIITLYEHPQGWPFAVAGSYQEWHDLTDKEVIEYLQKA